MHRKQSKAVKSNHISVGITTDILVTEFFIGRKVAIDASMSIYQFLIAVRQEGNTLMNAEGESTR